MLVVLILNLAAAAFFALDRYSRTQPQSCAVCHAMAPYVESYLADGHLDGVHRQADVGCRDCHSDYTALDELASAWRYVWGNYQIGGRTFDQAMCNRCHISLAHQATRTDFLVRNPHLSHWPDLVCGDCHRAHDQQIDYCGYCHDNGGQRMTGQPITPRADNPWARMTPTPQEP